MKFMKLIKFTEIIDKDFDDYEIGSSFVVEEPFRAKQPKHRLGNNSEVYWSMKLFNKNETRGNICIDA